MPLYTTYMVWCADNILIYDPMKDQITASEPIPDFLKGTKEWAGGVAIDGKIYGVPYVSKCVYRPFHSLNADSSKVLLHPLPPLN